MRSYLTRIGAIAAMGAVLVALPMCANDSAQTSSIPGNNVAGDESAARAALAGRPLGHVVSTNAKGSARFILGSTEADRAPAQLAVSPELAARVHLSRHASLFGLTEAAVQSAQVTNTETLSKGGSIVRFEQRVDGVPVFQSRASVLLDATKNLVSLTSSLHPAAAGSKALTFATSAESVLASVYATHFGRSLPVSAVRDLGSKNGGETRDYAVSTDADAPRLVDATAKRVLFPNGDTLTPAYHVEFIGRAPGSVVDDGYAYVVDATSGALLYKASITANEAFNYRVWADPNGNHIPNDGPYVDQTPYTKAPEPGNAEPAFADPVLISMNGFNKNADPWLPAGATVTSGNNVHAYSDRSDQHIANDAGVTIGDGFDPGVDIEATTTSANTFDRVYDHTREPNADSEQIKAAVTQIFYVTNWLHDYWYDSGFNEAAGVAQVSNFGRGGVEGDPLHAEAQDGADFGQANNANMSTPADGRSPRMQMFVWSPAMKHKVVTTPAVTFNDGSGSTVTGKQVFDVTQELMLSADGTANPTFGCQAPATPTAAGKILLIDRVPITGAPCTLATQLQNAQTAGAAGVILINNAPGAPNITGTIPNTETLAILTLSPRNGADLKSKLAAGTVTATLHRALEAPKQDGTIDNAVVAHEWGHCLHHRLVNCGSQACGGMSEGWADFDALLMTVRDGDPLEGSVFPGVQYAAAGIAPEGALYYGVRRAPYSTDFAKNPFTFKHVRQAATLPTTAPLAITGSDPSEVHNVGEIWAQTLFEAYVNFQKTGTGTFEEKKRRFANILVAGMKITPVEPTFTEQRDALLTAALADGTADEFKAMAQGFQKRGLGAGAIAPPASSATLNEAVENFDFVGNLLLTSLTLEEARSCDHDGHLDAGETGKLTIQVKNIGWLALKNTKINVSSTDPNITFDRHKDTIRKIDPLLDVVTLTFEVKIGRKAPQRAILPIKVTVSNPDSFTKTKDYTLETLYNYDDALNSSATDNVESEKVAWTFTHNGPTAFNAWSREGTPVNHVWHGDDNGTTTDEQLVSPDLAVGSAGNFTISFKHRYQFEFSSNTFFDGGVFEVSEDGGATWKDVSAYGIDPHYDGTLDPGNPMPGRLAFGSASAGYPAFTNGSFDFGKALAGKTVKVRFRVATDGGVGAAGWDIDDIAFGGIKNTPFATIVDDATACRRGHRRRDRDGQRNDDQWEWDDQ